MFEYNICKEANNEKFNSACKLIEENIIGLNAEKPLVDVDGSMIQIYNCVDGKIKVYNDYEVDAVYINSEIKLDSIF